MKIKSFRITVADTHVVIKRDKRKIYEAQKRYRSKHREKYNEYMRAYYAKNKEELNARRRVKARTTIPRKSEQHATEEQLLAAVVAQESAATSL